MELSIKLYDQKDELVAEIKRNEWISGNPMPWDLESGFQRLRIRRKLRDIELEIDGKKFPIDIRADLWRHGENFILTSNGVEFVSSKKGRVTLGDLCFVNSQLVVDTVKKDFKIAQNLSLGEWGFISEQDVKVRIQKGLKKWEEINCKHEFVTVSNKKKYSVRICNKCGKKEKNWN